MKHSYDSIYLSPHLDDAALSCGGQIYEQTRRGETVLVVTVAAGEPQTEIRSVFALFLHHNWGFTAEEGVALRRAEDRDACERLGADGLHWSLPDCIYRLHPHDETPLYTSNEDIFGSVHDAEQPLIETIAHFMRELPSSPQIVAPLGAGNHVDHQLVRLAAEMVWGETLLYYEDYPYVQRNPEEVSSLVIPPERWRSTLKSLTPASVQARIDAISAYRSQISTLFNSMDEMASAVMRQVEETGGERLWYRVAKDADLA